ncbi:Uncharacterised protein [Bordetella ansorpii]|uniref:Uncharacterized protein n=1 Tax=Bordetella ansorpii TaxID=288768 RepID=A0A157NXF3_9BORD|nr:hypothetical protein [Bordetella ansorpii]SAI25760.1 Uncharacterised protein [Bordetella ansorpii]
MDASVEFEVYALISCYVRALNDEDRIMLQARFGVGEPIVQEITESLDGYFGRRPDIGLAPSDVAFSGKRGSQPFIDLYETNEPGFWGADCVIWVDGKPQEPTLHVELSKPDGELRLRHKYIGS